MVEDILKNDDNDCDVTGTDWRMMTESVMERGKGQQVGLVMSAGHRVGGRRWRPYRR